MSTYNETGHAINVANLKRLIAFVNGYGAVYMPTKVSLTLAKLEILNTAAVASLGSVVVNNTAFNEVVNERMAAFKKLSSLSTRLVNALEVTDASAETIKNAKFFKRKLIGQRASGVQQVPVGTLAPNTISASQQSYTQRVQHLTGLVEILTQEPSYAPNEVELSLVELESYMVVLNNMNSKVAEKYADVNNSRLERNRVLYDNDDALVKTALEVKKYIKSLFGAKSSEFGQVSGIYFKRVR